VQRPLESKNFFYSSLKNSQISAITADGIKVYIAEKIYCPIIAPPSKFWLVYKKVKYNPNDNTRNVLMNLLLYPFLVIFFVIKFIKKGFRFHLTRSQTKICLDIYIFLYKKRHPYPKTTFLFVNDFNPSRPFSLPYHDFLTHQKGSDASDPGDWLMDCSFSHSRKSAVASLILAVACSIVPPCETMPSSKFLVTYCPSESRRITMLWLMMY